MEHVASCPQEWGLVAIVLPVCCIIADPRMCVWWGIMQMGTAKWERTVMAIEERVQVGGLHVSSIMRERDKFIWRIPVWPGVLPAMPGS
jgi:hypothetical protein